MNGLIVKFPETRESGLETKGERQLPSVAVVAFRKTIGSRLSGLKRRQSGGIFPASYSLCKVNILSGHFLCKPRPLPLGILGRSLLNPKGLHKEVTT